MSRDKRKKRKIFLLFIVILITAVILAVETYAWFVGLSTVNTNSFNISVSSGGGLEISLDGEHWKKNDQTLTISSSTITATSGSGDHAYEGNTNSWVDSGGLVPVSSSGILSTTTGRLKIFEKSSLASTDGGYRLVATQIDNSVNEAGSYVAFDIFIRNGVEDVYANTNFDTTAAENIYLKNDSSATVNGSTGYGAANSIRVGFYLIAGMKAYGAQVSDIIGLSCSTETSSSTNKIRLCTSTTGTTAGRTVRWNIWEPNNGSHTTSASNFFSSACKQRSSSGYSSTACTALGSSTKTYAVFGNIAATDDVDIYDGLNGFTSHTYNSSTNPDGLLYNVTTYKTPGATPNYTESNQLLKLGGNSITKIRVYIWLEGQDPDNYDIIAQDTNVNIKFGFTKDRYQINT